MQRRITNPRRSDDEVVKEGGLLLDFDEALGYLQFQSRFFE